MTYPTSYHRAIEHLIRHGAWHRTRLGRHLIAVALCHLRAQGRQGAHHERRHLAMICGMMPAKHSHPLHPSHDVDSP